MLDLRLQIAVSPATQDQIAAVIGMSPSQFSRVLRGLSPIPKKRPMFFEEVANAIQRAEEAERAADKARRQVLDKEDVEEDDGQISLFD